MDMKFADLTHMQLKRSLDQIHGLDSARSSSVTNLIYSSVPSVGNTCYSHELDVKNDLLKPWRHNSAGNFYQHGTATTTFENGHTVSSQSNKFDAVLQVKDAMLQEKESVILKLRLQVAALQHHMKEGDAALRQVMTSHYTTVSKSSSSNLGKTVNIEAQKRIHDLDRMLGKVESDLEETKSQYAREKTHHEDRIKNLEAYLKLRDQSISDWKNKYRACNDRMEKYKKRVESLERYLGGLPTVEESNKLKTEADILGVERENMIVEINNLKDKLEITN
uniref:Uncharacterized protein n=1 Tax=Ciona savignyi TaxID=51511 RepID=H2ZR46_CIOSA